MPSAQELTQIPNRPLWHAPSRARDTLEREAQADVVIVGAGYTGLWTAYYLLKAQPSLNVVLLERETVGFGASGRNGGWASAIFPISLERVAHMYSHAAALHLQAAMNETVSEIGRVLDLEGIDADYAKQGFLSLARSQPQFDRIQASVDASVRFGLPDQWRTLDAKQASTRIGARHVLGGLYTEHCALIHPGKLVRGLAAVVETMGARIFEKTAALRIAPGKVSTAHGGVTARTVVRATEAFSCQLPDSSRSVIPLYSLVLATEPLPQALRQRLGLDHRLAFNDMRHLRVYGQVTAEGRLVFGGRGAPYRFGSRMAPEDDLVDKVHANIHAAMLEFFPDLAAARITHRWGGALGVSRDWCPTVSMDKDARIAWAGNYVGDGVATSNLAGRILRNLILDRDEEINLLPVVNHRSPAWEPEPFRWIGVNGGLTAAGFSDFEERVTRQPSRTARVLEKLTGAH
ncbi:NAD(P)/FAD-dependent oxidoreductase [Paraburkholderia unamae]|uniref:Glycine/D-amino acid oxidase-like deaminating enzyme n=1 Tax=Paraburkholderia unamae TaxID=219649 RepID=A0ABX5KEF0_9BURK|nr:FAD-dependent oxidoreductase [Paraburkholderia unamae]PVX73169.1 glycine/D-amino acid oxidase-like deaminating enzyme [Paraburkholderia unamae]CAG9262820.1 FAD dependent oxidoreductase [Paraburkholderia unamae]